MIRTRGRKIISDVLGRKGRTALVSLAIFIGVAGTIALFSMSNILVGQLKEDVKEDKLAMLDVRITINEDVELVNDTYLQALNELTGTTNVIGVVNAVCQFKLNADDETFQDGFINASSVPYSSASPIEPLRLVSGRYPSQDANEIAIEQRLADKYGLKVGDRIFLRISSPSREKSQAGATGTMEVWTIAGIVFNPYVGASEEGGPGGLEATPEESMYSHVNDANYVSGTTGYTHFKARFVDYSTAEEMSGEFISLIADDMPYIPVSAHSADPANNELVSKAEQIGSIMSYLALASLVVTGFLVFNVISAIVGEQRRQIGLLKALGATRLDNLLMYCGIAFAYGVIGVVPGVIVGIPGGYVASSLLAPRMDTVLGGFQISPVAIAIGVLVGLLTPVLAAIVPVFLGTRVKILEAFTDLGLDARYGAGPIARLIGILPLPTTIRQGLSNASLKKGRLALTVITLAIAVGVFMGIFAAFTSLITGFDMFADYNNVEIGVFPFEGREPAEVITVLEDDFQAAGNETLASIEPGFQAQIEIEGYESKLMGDRGGGGVNAYGYAVESDTPAFNFSMTEGEILSTDTAGDGVILSNLLANNMGKGIGDTIVVNSFGITTELTIVGVSEYLLEQIWLDWRTLALAVGYTANAPTPNMYFTAVILENYEGSLPDNQVTIVGIDDRAEEYLILGQFEQGEFITPGEPGIILSQDAAANGGYSVGDTLTLAATTQDGASAEYPIVGIFRLPEISDEEASSEETASEEESEEIPPDIVCMFWLDLARLEGVDLSGDPLPRGYFVTTNLDDPTLDELDGIVDEVNDVMLDNGIPSYTFNYVAGMESFRQMFQTFQVIMQLVAGLIALVGALGLLTTLSMNVFERQREIGVMRAIGAGSATVAAQFLTEGLLVGLMAWVVGLPLAAALQALLLDVGGFTDFLAVTFPLVAAIYGLVGIAIVSTIASLWPSIVAARKTVSNTLRYQ